jgi:hypothetical protein
MNKELRKYMAKIGRKGGNAGKGKPKSRNKLEARANAKRAAAIRWGKEQKVKAEEFISGIIAPHGNQRWT